MLNCVSSDVAWCHGRLTVYGISVHVANFDLLARFESARLSMQPELSQIGSTQSVVCWITYMVQTRSDCGPFRTTGSRYAAKLCRSDRTESTQPWWCLVSSHSVSTDLARRFDQTRTSPSTGLAEPSLVSSHPHMSLEPPRACMPRAKLSKKVLQKLLKAHGVLFRLFLLHNFSNSISYIVRIQYYVFIHHLMINYNIQILYY